MSVNGARGRGAKIMNPRGFLRNAGYGALGGAMLAAATPRASAFAFANEAHFYAQIDELAMVA